MRKFCILWVSLIALFMMGCSPKHYELSEPKIITLKTPKLKFADTGYIRHDDSSLEVELFTAGVAVEKISIGDQVCVSAGCMSEEAFVKEYLYPDYPVIQCAMFYWAKISLAVKGKRRCAMDGCFSLSAMRRWISSTAEGWGEIYFKDRLNSLIIKIEDLKENNATE
jgi:hypothetical protein